MGEPTAGYVGADSKIAHLEMIQDVVTRLAQASFQTKAWSVALMGGVLAFAPASAGFAIWLAVAPAIGFWFLDGYYLRQERLFRELYNAAVEEKVPAFSMKTTLVESKVDALIVVACTGTVQLVHAVTVLGILAKAANAQGWLFN